MSLRPLMRQSLCIATIEATTGWRWVWRELVAMGFEVRLVEPDGRLLVASLAGRVARVDPARGRVEWLH